MLNSANYSETKIRYVDVYESTVMLTHIIEFYINILEITAILQILRGKYFLLQLRSTVVIKILFICNFPLFSFFRENAENLIENKMSH